MRLRRFPVLVLCGSLAMAQIPTIDRRITDAPNTDSHFTFTAPATLGAWQIRRIALRQQILAAGGLLPMPVKTPLHPRLFGKLSHPGYTIEKALLETLPGYYLGGNLYRPTSPGRHPAVLIAHGHWQYGRLENEQLCSNPSLAETLARLGFVVFLYDMVGYNDTIQTPHHFGGDREKLWSFTPLGLQLWNSTRVVDFLEALPYVDPVRIGMTGASGGGSQTFLLTAVDERIQFIAPVNMVSAYMQGGDMCEYAPGLRVGTNNVEIAALAAPRPMLLVSATGDWTKHVPKEEFPEIQAAYALYGKRGQVSVTQFDAPHNYNLESREAVEQFFDKTMLADPKAPQVAEHGVQIEMLQDMLALFNRTLPAGALNYNQLLDEWRRMAVTQMDGIGDLERLRGILTTTLGVEWPSHVSSERLHGRGAMVLGRAGAGDRVPALWHHGGRTAVLLLDADGAQAALRGAAGRQALRHGDSVLAIDAFQTGSAKASRDESRPDYLAFNLSDDANRVQDVLTAIRYLSEQRYSTINVVATGRAAWWAAFAAALVPADVRLRLDVPSQTLSGNEDAFLANFNVPGVLRAGGLHTATRLLQAAHRMPGPRAKQVSRLRRREP